MPYLSSNGVRLHYQQFGTGPDVVLVHALTANLAVWMGTPLVYSLAEQFRVTIYDLRGHGQSDAPGTGYTSADMAQDLMGLLDQLDISRAVLVGHSFGGVVGVHTAALWPERVHGVIVSDPYFPGLAHLEPNLGASPVWQNVKRIYGRIGIDLGDRVDFTRLFQAAATVTDEQMTQLRGEVGAGGARWLAQLPKLAGTTCGSEAFSAAGLDATLLSTIALPIVALYDEYTPFQATREFLAGHMPNVLIETVPGARHLALLESTTAFVELVHKHLQVLIPRPEAMPVPKASLAHVV
jgi:pimeloyl-ACP methyl ester carboxylesterase